MAKIDSSISPNIDQRGTIGDVRVSASSSSTSEVQDTNFSSLRKSPQNEQQESSSQSNELNLNTTIDEIRKAINYIAERETEIQSDKNAAGDERLQRELNSLRLQRAQLQAGSSMSVHARVL